MSLTSIYSLSYFLFTRRQPEHAQTKGIHKIHAVTRNISKEVHCPCIQ